MVKTNGIADQAGTSPGKYCRILIEDNGIGFEQQYADHIFTMFRRLHNSSEFEGTGIGLAICKKIVEKHNGYIAAQGEPGIGSVFSITLPCKQPVAQDVGSLNVLH